MNFKKNHHDKMIETILYGINGLLYLTLIATWIIIPEYKAFNLSFSAFTILLSCFLIWRYKKGLNQWVQGPQFKKFISVLISAVLLFLILALVNYLSVKYLVQKDFTLNKVNTLSDQSIQLAKKISKPLDVKIYIRHQDHAAPLALLELYRIHNSLIHIEAIDPDTHPSEVKKDQVTRYGSIVIKYNGRRAMTESISEVDISTAILKTMRVKSPAVAYVVGHGEESLEDPSEKGNAYFKSLLLQNGYELKNISLLSSKLVPPDIDLLMLWGPKNSLTSEELLVLREYVNRGGKLFIALDPNLNGFKLQGLADYFYEFGLGINNDLVIDQASFVNGSDGMIPLITKATGGLNSKHLVTANFNEQFFLPLSLSFSVKKTSPEWNIEALLLSSGSEQSYSKKNLDDILKKKFQFVPGVDAMGPSTMMVSLERKDRDKDKKQQKILLIGNSSFISNIYQNYGGQYNFALNCLAWLLDESFVISNDRPLIKDEPVYLSSYQIAVLFYFSIIIGPLLLIGGAIFFYIRRKRM